MLTSLWSKIRGDHSPLGRVIISPTSRLGDGGTRLSQLFEDLRHRGPQVVDSLLAVIYHVLRVSCLKPIYLPHTEYSLLQQSQHNRLISLLKFNS
jgi:hypothetical protein